MLHNTGLIPYHVFIHTSGGMTQSIAGNGTLLHLPLVTGFDIAIARFVLEFVTDIVVALVLLSGFGAIGFTVLPDDAWRAAAALLATGLLGCGVGLINAVLGVFVKSWERIWNQLARVLYFASGIFYVPAMMPKWVRDILVWNPVLQAVDWYRSGFYAGYQPHWLDRRYLVVVALTAALGGFALQRVSRRRTEVPS